MKQVIVLKLIPTEAQRQALLETVEAFNRGCDYVASVAFEKRMANKIAIQPFVYGELRARFGLSAQMAVRCISKAIEAYKRDKSIRPKFDPHGAMVFDDRMMGFKGVSHVSLLTLTGRVIVPLRYGEYQAARIDRRQGQADLILRDGAFYLHATIDLPTPPLTDPEGVIGVDTGIAEIAVDSEGNFYSGEPIQAVRRRVKRIRSLLQSKGTKSAKRRLKRIARKQSRFIRDANHRISKKIVQTAKDSRKALALENLKGIRDRANGFNREMRWLMGNWSFAQLHAFIGYKAEMRGIRVIRIDPRDTSRTCHQCGFCDKANRKSQARFKCLRCGLDANADFNAAKNIQTRAELSYGLLRQANRVAA